MSYAQTFQPYLTQLAAKTPAPGGGSAGVLSLCVGISLIQMAIRYSDRKEDDFLSKTDCLLSQIQEQMIVNIDRDGDLFARLIREQDSNEKLRLTQELESLTHQIGFACIRVLRRAMKVKERIKTSLLSDFDIGITMITTALYTVVKHCESNQKTFGEISQRRLALFKTCRDAFLNFEGSKK